MSHATRTLMATGFMTFSLFLGAGNLIFPVMAGYLAGVQWPLAALGFLATAVGLPMLAIVTMARCGGGFQSIGRDIPSWFLLLLGLVIHLLIGPLYATPRTSAVAFEIAIHPFLTGNDETVRLIFNILFISAAAALAMNPGRLAEYIGEKLTPILLLLLAVLGLAPLAMNIPVLGLAEGAYAQGAIARGFTDGYMTMDALAAMLFGTVIITTLQSHGIQNRQELTRYTIFAGLMAAAGLAAVYLSLFNLGATSREVIEVPVNGGELLSRFASWRFGSGGSLILGGVVLLACLTTATGCLSAVAQYFSRQFAYLSYRSYVLVLAMACLLVVNLRLEELIYYYEPVLLFIYPLAICVLVLNLLRPVLVLPKITNRIILLVTVLLNVFFIHTELSYYTIPKSLLACIPAWLEWPGSHSHMIWVIPATLILLFLQLAGRIQGKKPDVEPE